MISAKKLLPETNEEQEFSQEHVPDNNDSRTQHIVKLLIMMLLTYAIIFM